jgi:hypothetical protein
MVKIKEDIQVYTNKKFRILFLSLLIAGIFVGNLCAQEAVTAEDTTTIVEEEVVVEVGGTTQAGGIEALARKIVGSGLVDLFIKGGWVMYPMLILVIWALATSIWKIISLRYAKISVHDFSEKLLPLVKEKNSMKQ